MQQFKLNPVTNFCLSCSWHWKFMENSLENTAGMDETFSSPFGDALEEPQFPWRVSPLFFLLHRLVASMGPKVDPSGVLPILGTHPLFPKAQLCVLNKFPDLQSKPGVSFTFIYFLGFFFNKFLQCSQTSGCVRGFRRKSWSSVFMDFGSSGINHWKLFWLQE